MIDENELGNEASDTTDNESVEAEPLGHKSTPGERKDGAERKARFDARKKAAEETAERQVRILSEKQIQRRKAAADAEVASALNRLTPEQRAAIEVNTEEFPGWRQLCDQMFDVVAMCDLELFNGCRPDIVFEFVQEFLAKHPYAKDLIRPRAWYADKDYRGWLSEYGDYLFAIRDSKRKVLVSFEPDAPVQFPIDVFFNAVKLYDKWRSRTPGATDTVEPLPTKRGRGRPKRLTVPDALPPADPAVAAIWSKPPERPQAEIWKEHDANLAARAIERDVQHAEVTKPVVFPGM